jgi:hypothetical protein
LDLKVAVAFDTSTRGQVTVDALTYRMAQGLKMSDGPDKVAFPATRAEWQAVAAQVPGVDLVSWDGKDEDLGFRSHTVLSFATSTALEGLFAAFKQKLTLRQDFQGKWNMVLVSQIPRLTGGDTQARQLWTTLWGTTVWTFAFTPPNQPVHERRVVLVDLAGQQPLEWTLVW